LIQSFILLPEGTTGLGTDLSKRIVKNGTSSGMLMIVKIENKILETMLNIKFRL
jgi:hypothetical protein